MKDPQLVDLDAIALEMVAGSKAKLRQARRRARRIARAVPPNAHDPARVRILDAVNNWLSSHNPNAPTLGRRHLQQAVCIARRRLLVSDETLRAAGFNGVAVRPAKRREPWGGRGGFVRPDQLRSDFVGRKRPKR